VHCAPGRGLVSQPLPEGPLAALLEWRVARWIGLPARIVDQVSGHSTRVGATQDLLALNIDLASVMQAGGWKSARMPVRYGEHTLAARGGMAKAAEIQNRS